MGEARISSSAPGQLFRFCELDFPFPLGPADGRYLRRGADGREVAVVAVRALDAPRRRRLRGRRAARAAPAQTAPESVPITRATVIGAEPFPDAGAAAEWLRRCRVSREAAAAEVTQALELVNLAVCAHRAAALDPHVRDVVAVDLQRVRLGYGTGDEVVEGSWREAIAVPPEPARGRQRRKVLSPQEEMAGMLSGRRPGARPSEELFLRAQLDFEHGRTVEAALTARAAADAFAAEESESEAARRHRQGAAGLAGLALADGLSADQVAELEQLLEALARDLRRRRYADGA